KNKVAQDQMLRGDPGPAARRWLLMVGIVAAVLFAVNTILVMARLTYGFDVALEQAAQSVDWGPLVPVMNATNRSGGVIQDVLAVIIVIALFAWNRRAGLLMALGALGSGICQVFKVLLVRHRPTVDIVKVLDPSRGFSYPSGHAVFFTWIAVMLAMALVPHVPRNWRFVIWTLAALLVFVGGLGRVWGGAHWPSDVTGGILLAISWCAFALWFPERFLPGPRDQEKGPARRRQKRPSTA
ncbi:MAG: phosphatase PAP2 family protein, partial [Candidatus Dormibacteraeota bacterium]|nr:phosphatase PAP2 family protein [Candidatus Dormibacteraeota bacterium]